MRTYDGKVIYFQGIRLGKFYRIREETSNCICDKILINPGRQSFDQIILSLLFLQLGTLFILPDNSVSVSQVTPLGCQFNYTIGISMTGYIKEPRIEYLGGLDRCKHRNDLHLNGSIQAIVATGCTICIFNVRYKLVIEFPDLVITM